MAKNITKNRVKMAKLMLNIFKPFDINVKFLNNLVKQILSESIFSNVHILKNKTQKKVWSKLNTMPQFQPDLSGKLKLKNIS